MAFWSCSEGRSGSTPSGSLKAPVDDRDTAVPEQLRGAESNLAKPHEIDSYFHAPSEAAARTIADRLAAEGFEIVGVECSTSGDDNDLCLAKKSMIPELVTLQALRKRMTTLAA
ncbi:MAG: ribonuclease E inhibitor RraB [Planctomycetes bacterium]|nr:ribonuclease E inhibitor RraB [Planctomycetota bacterium]